MGGGQIEAGSMCRSERIAKYNRLLEIEGELGKVAQFDGMNALTMTGTGRLEVFGESSRRSHRSTVRRLPWQTAPAGEGAEYPTRPPMAGTI